MLTSARAAGAAAPVGPALALGWRTLETPPQPLPSPAVRAARNQYFKSSVEVADLVKSPQLSEHFQAYSLRDFYDKQGVRRYQNLTVTIAAKQIPDVAGTFGTVGSVRAESPHKKPKLSARALRCAAQTLRRDREATRTRAQSSATTAASDGGGSEFAAEHMPDVDRRRQAMFFVEVSDFEHHLPRGWAAEGLLPPEVSWEQHMDERRRFERLNHSFFNTAMQKAGASRWLFSLEQAHELAVHAEVWSRAAGLCPDVGMDRATLLRFLLDVGFHDDDRVPFLWAASVVDGHAKYVRAYFGDVEWHDPFFEGRVSVTRMVCKWDIAEVMDCLLRQRLRETSGTARATEVSETLFRVGKEAKILSHEMHLSDDEDATAAWSSSAKPQGLVHETMHDTGVARVKASEVAAVAERHAARWHRRISGMLVEPEVLHLVEQHRQVFRQIFRCYARPRFGDSGPAAMEFIDFLQFCRDFALVPQIATSHEAMVAYRMAECLEVVTQPAERKEPNAAAAVDDPTGVQVEDLPPRLLSKPKAVRKKITAGRSPTLESSGPSNDDSPAATARRSSGTRLAVVGAGPTGSSSVSPTPPAQERRPSHMRPPSRETLAPQQNSSPGPGGDSLVPASRPCSVQSTAPPLRVEVFTSAAFVESLARLTFMHLADRGNTLQLGAPSQAMMVWLISYLSSTFSRLHESHLKRCCTNSSPEVAAVVRHVMSSVASSEEDGAEEHVLREASQGSHSQQNPTVSPQLARVLATMSPLVFISVEPVVLQQPATTFCTQADSDQVHAASDTASRRAARSMDPPRFVPQVRKDSLSVNDWLFARLMRGRKALRAHYGPSRGRRHIAIPVRPSSRPCQEHAAAALASTPGAALLSVLPSVSPVSRDDDGSMAQPSTPQAFSEDRALLERDMDHFSPQLIQSRCNLTPPPQTPFAKELNVRIQTLLTSKPTPRRGAGTARTTSSAWRTV